MHQKIYGLDQKIVWLEARVPENPRQFLGFESLWMIRSYQRGSLASKMAKNLGAMGLHHGFFEISDGPNPWFLYWMMMMDLKILFFLFWKFVMNDFYMIFIWVLLKADASV